MTYSIRVFSLTIAITVTSLTFWPGGRHIAHAVDQAAQPTLELPELIQEALARNPEIVAARQQWKAAKNRITQVQSLDDPTVSV